MKRDRPAQGGFTLLEVMIAVAILSLSLTSLLSAQMEAMRATRYARGVSVAAFLAESKLLDLEAQGRRDGWSTSDKTFEGDFADEQWPDIRYECLIDFIEIPDFNAIQQAHDAADSDGGFGGGGLPNVADAADQSVAGMGMFWPVIKGAIEQAIRKASCKVIWTDGAREYDFTVETFWTDPKALSSLPQVGGEIDETDDTRDDDGGSAPGSGAGSGRGGGGGGGGRGLTPAGLGGAKPAGGGTR